MSAHALYAVFSHFCCDVFGRLWDPGVPHRGLEPGMLWQYAHARMQTNMFVVSGLACVKGLKVMKVPFALKMAWMVWLKNRSLSMTQWPGLGHHLVKMKLDLNAWGAM